MDFDVAGHIAAVERSVSSLERDGQPARAATLARTYPTRLEDLWDAVTNGERIPRWFLPSHLAAAISWKATRVA